MRSILRRTSRLSRLVRLIRNWLGIARWSTMRRSKLLRLCRLVRLRRCGSASRRPRHNDETLLFCCCRFVFLLSLVCVCVFFTYYKVILRLLRFLCTVGGVVFASGVPPFPLVGSTVDSTYGNNNSLIGRFCALAGLNGSPSSTESFNLFVVVWHRRLHQKKDITMGENLKVAFS